MLALFCHLINYKRLTLTLSTLIIFWITINHILNEGFLNTFTFVDITIKTSLTIAVSLTFTAGN